MRVKKTVFVLDTSVLVWDHKVLETFEDCDLVLPITVLDELDKLKKMSNETGRNARLVTRRIDELLASGGTEVKLPNNVTFSIVSQFENANSLNEYGDVRILTCAKQLAEKGRRVVIVSRDINLRIRARAAGLESQDHDRAEFSTTELYLGYRTVKDAGLGLELHERGSLECVGGLADMNPNEFALFVDDTGNGIAAGRRIKNKIQLVVEKPMWGLSVRGKEQLFASDLLMDTHVPLVSLIGRAGGGKSLLAIAAGLELVINQRRYSRFIIYRPIQPMGSDIGYLPGTVQEKLQPHFEAISDSMQFLFSGKSRKRDSWKEQLFQFMQSGVISWEALTYIRGRSIANAFILLDEAQNLSNDEIKAILTRAGEGSKIVVTGDIEQIDNDRLDPINNGLTHIVERFKPYELAGHVTLTKGERSELATLSSKIL